jgi:hypothetical protein
MEASGSPPAERVPLSYLAAKYPVSLRTLQHWARDGLPSRLLGRSQVTSERELLEYCQTIRGRSRCAVEILRSAARSGTPPETPLPQSESSAFLRDAGRAASIDALLEALEAAAQTALDVARGQRIQIGRLAAAWRANEPPVDIEAVPDHPDSRGAMDSDAAGA